MEELANMYIGTLNVYHSSLRVGKASVKAPYIEGF